jgi:hypothetical protein
MVDSRSILRARAGLPRNHSRASALPQSLALRRVDLISVSLAQQNTTEVRGDGERNDAALGHPDARCVIERVAQHNVR